MPATTAFARPLANHYDVVIVGGAMLGSSVAWFLKDNADFDGTVLVVERDPSYKFAATSHTNSCMRQQFTAAINVKVSQFSADFVKNFRSYLGDDPRVPQPRLHSFGYMYLADSPARATALQEAQKVQAAAGAGTRYMTRAEIAQDYPFYQLDDIIGGNHNKVDEGYFDGDTLFDWWKRQARERGVEYIANEVAGFRHNAAGTAITEVTLATGESIGCGCVVNAAGTRGAVVARMAGIDIPIEPRKRFTFVFDAATPLDRDLPLTIDPSGVHFRTDGRYYMAGCAPAEDHAVPHDDFKMDHDIWQDHVWPIVATRVPQFEAVRLLNSWAGHYDYNTLDQNAILGPHDRIANFMFVNGFSGHGFQQSPAMGRGVAELIAYGEFRSLDLSCFGFERVATGQPFVEKAVI